MYKLPERRGGGGEVIRAMPERKHLFLYEVFPKTFCDKSAYIQFFPHNPVFRSERVPKSSRTPFVYFNEPARFGQFVKYTLFRSTFCPHLVPISAAEDPHFTQN